MATISRTSYTDGQPITASGQNTNEDTIVNVINGNLDNDNIKASAGIVDSKLAQITTASKVSGAAITLLASIPAGAGSMNVANLPGVQTSVKAVTLTMTNASATTQIVTGVGFLPRIAIGWGAYVTSTGSFTIGSCDMNTNQAYFVTRGGQTGNDTYSDSTVYLAEFSNSASHMQQIKVVSFNSDGCIIEYTKTGSPVDTSQLNMAFIR